ncbi:hypothetical protein, partial [Stenotrophomonas maltophilia group sp. RNC7]|uniref:hypothetical protein n=1 Tax=Stenotrophomonas maltophilia group sp. RNC7 TaxID=3071467 RepID=UPI0027DFFE4F
EEDPGQGFTLEEDHLVMATFLKKEASLKKPSVPSPDTFDQSANDDALIKAHNDKAKQGLEEKRDQSLGNIKKGLASIAKVAAVGILVAATGGLAAGPLVTVLVVGSATAKVAMSVSDMVEGVQDYN